MTDREVLQSIVDAYDFRSELFTSDEDCAGNLADRARLQLAAPVAAQEPAGTLHDDGRFTWKGTEPNEARYAGWRADFYLLAPAADGAQGERQVDDAARLDSLHRAVERLTAALHVATLRAHPHMTHAEIQAEIVRIARTPAPAADGAQGERQPDAWRRKKEGVTEWTESEPLFPGSWTPVYE